MSHLTNQLSDVSYAASAIATFTGTVTWLNDNAGAVGAMCAIGGLLVAIATFLLNAYRK